MAHGLQLHQAFGFEGATHPGDDDAVQVLLFHRTWVNSVTGGGSAGRAGGEVAGHSVEAVVSQ